MLCESDLSEQRASFDLVARNAHLQKKFIRPNQLDQIYPSEFFHDVHGRYHNERRHRGSHQRWLLLGLKSGTFYMYSTHLHMVFFLRHSPCHRNGTWIFFYNFSLQAIPLSFTAWLSYTVAVTCVFCIIQYITHRLHSEFDKYEPVARPSEAYEELGATERFAKCSVLLLFSTRDPAVHRSELSLDAHCNRASTHSYASIEDVDEQCRRIGMAGLCIAGE